jgi:hypothetical protein
MDDQLASLLEEIAGLIAQGLQQTQLQPGQNAAVLDGPITVVAPTPNEYDS